MVGIAWSGPDIGTDGRLRVPGTPGNKRIFSPNGRDMHDAVPVRCVAVHACYPDTPFFRIVRAFYVFVFPSDSRARMVFHCGKLCLTNKRQRRSRIHKHTHTHTHTKMQCGKMVDGVKNNLSISPFV